MISWAIMGHPRRADNIEKMLFRLGQQGQNEVQVFVDTKGEGVWSTARRAWSSMHPEASHHIVLQDDISFCEDFASAASRYVLDVPVSFFYMRAFKHFCMSQAVMMPVALVRRFLAWCAAGPGNEPGVMDDLLLGRFLQEQGIGMRYASPSLVEHVGHDNPVRNCLSGPVARVAEKYIGDHAFAPGVAQWLR